jgi:hypothetical protein
MNLVSFAIPIRFLVSAILLFSGVCRTTGPPADLTITLQPLYGLFPRVTAELPQVSPFHPPIPSHIRKDEAASIWNELESYDYDPENLCMYPIPNKDTYRVGENFDITVQVGDASGYLALLECKPDNSIDLLFPHWDSAAEAYIEANHSKRLSCDSDILPHFQIAKQTELRAVLFPDAWHLHAFIARVTDKALRSVSSHGHSLPMQPKFFPLIIQVE